MNDDKTLTELLNGCESDVESSLMDALGLVSASSEAVAAELTGDHHGFRPTWFCHDPNQLLQHGRSELHHVSIPLSIGPRIAGHLILRFDRQVDPAGVRDQARPLATAIAFMLTGFLYSCCRNGLLDVFAFRQRIASEINRANRSRKGFSLVHIDLAVGESTGGKQVCDWRRTARVGDELLRKMRASDAIGLTGPTSVCVFLTDCSPLSAMVAERRIEHFLRELAMQDDVAPSLKVISYPQHASTEQELLEVSYSSNRPAVAHSSAGGGS